MGKCLTGCILKTAVLYLRSATSRVLGVFLLFIIRINKQKMCFVSLIVPNTVHISNPITNTYFAYFLALSTSVR